MMSNFSNMTINVYETIIEIGQMEMICLTVTKNISQLCDFHFFY